MNNLSKEYAMALFMAANEENMTHEYFDGLELIEKLLKENPKYTDFLSSPKVSGNERRIGMVEAFSEHMPINVINFVYLLADEKNISLLKACMREYKALMLNDDKVSEAFVTSASELTASEKERLQKKLEAMCGNTVIITYGVDKSLIGGMMVSINGRIIDGSIKGRLKEMKEVMER